MNFASLISSFATGTYTVTRRAAPTVGSDGRAVPGASSSVSIKASVQALNGRDLQQLTEGLRVAERRKLYTTTLLQAINSPDVVTIGADTWEVETVEDWATLGGYYKVIITKVGN